MFGCYCSGCKTGIINLHKVWYNENTQEVFCSIDCLMKSKGFKEKTLGYDVMKFSEGNLNNE